MPRCIYCLRDDPPSGFNREHVIQVALGRFEGDLVTLIDAVCRECNDYFGNTLDRILTRDSFEALLRLEHGLKDPAELDGMFERRLRVRLPVDGAKWGGAILRLRPHPEGATHPPVAELVPQVGFERKDGNGWDYIAADDLRTDVGPGERISEQYGKGRVILFDSEASRERVLATLAALGMSFRKEGELPGFPPFTPGEVTTEVLASFDNYVARAVCKIAFNYLAKTQGREFALRDEFNEVRRFVRYGEGRGGTFLTFDRESRFRDATGRRRRHAEHLLLLEWNAELDELVCRVILFGQTQYAVRLCTTWNGLWRPIMVGHRFDLDTKRVAQLVVTKIAPPWAPLRKAPHP